MRHWQTTLQRFSLSFCLPRTRKGKALSRTCRVKGMTGDVIEKYVLERVGKQEGKENSH